MKKFIPFLFLTIGLIAFSSCSATKGVAAKKKAKEPMGYVGNWSIIVSDTPVGNVDAELMIEKSEDGQYTGFFVSQGNKVKLDNLKIEGQKMTSSFYSSEYGMDISIEADLAEGDNAFSGWVLNDYKLTGNRKTETN